MLESLKHGFTRSSLCCNYSRPTETEKEEKTLLGTSHYKLKAN